MDGDIDFSEWHKELKEEVKKLRDKPKKQTNADSIRSMSDEELAAVTMCPDEAGLAEIGCDKSDSCNCYQCVLEWLQSEVEEENG